MVVKTKKQVQSLMDAHFFFIDDMDEDIGAGLRDALTQAKAAKKALRAIKGFPEAKQRALSDFDNVADDIEALLGVIDIIQGNIGADIEEAFVNHPELERHF